MGRRCRGGTETHLVCCGSFFIRREKKKVALWVHMSKESSIKVICWSLKYARTCFSARLGDPHVLPEAEQMKAPVGRDGSAGRAFHSRVGTSSGWESQRPTNSFLLSIWNPGPLACPVQGSKGLFSFESRPERMEPEEGVM